MLFLRIDSLKYVLQIGTVFYTPANSSANASFSTVEDFPLVISYRQVATAAH